MPNSRLEAKGFFAGLFDFGFTSFITLKFLRVIYVLVVAVVLLLGLAFFVTVAMQGGVFVVVALLVVPAVTLLYLVFARIGMEIVALLFRIGDDTSVMASGATASESSPHGAPRF